MTEVLTALEAVLVYRTQASLSEVFFEAKKRNPRITRDSVRGMLTFMTSQGTLQTKTLSSCGCSRVWWLND